MIPSGQPDVPAQNGARDCRTTHWSVVLPARAELCRVYWYPLYAYVRRLGRTSEDAQDRAQAFFARLIEKHRSITWTRPGAGSVRSC